MNSHRWERIESLYYSALNLEPATRSVFLQKACGEDEELLREVESLIAHTEAPSFLETPARQEGLEILRKLEEEKQTRPTLSKSDWTTEWSETLLGVAHTPWSSSSQSPLHPGDVLAGRYRIIAAIGAGGMGRVYESEDLNLNKRVALKTIRPEIASDPEIVQHFWAMHGEAEIALYSGDATLAYEVVNRDWGDLRRSLQVHLPVGAVFAYHLRARCSLAKAAAVSGKSFQRKSWLREAKRDALEVQRREMSCPEPIALLIRAGIASIGKETELAADLLSRAESGFERATMMVYAAVARRRRGELMSNYAGRALISSADAVMAGQGINRPDRIRAMIAPGF